MCVGLQKFLWRSVAALTEVGLKDRSNACGFVGSVQ